MMKFLFLILVVVAFFNFIKHIKDYISKEEKDNKSTIIWRIVLNLAVIIIALLAFLRES